MADYGLEIPFRVRVLDADSREPLVAAAALGGQDILYEPLADGPALGWANSDGVIDAVVWTLVGTSNPYTACFRRSFPGILIEIQQDGYKRYRCHVPLPAQEGQRVDLGTVYLKRDEESGP